MPPTLSPFSAFADDRLLASGDLLAVVAAAKAHADSAPDAAVLVFDDSRGEPLELDLRGTPAEVAARLGAHFVASTPAPASASPEATPEAAPTAAPARPTAGRGRPRLGVVAREVTLLPRHWDWLASQPGSASVTLRRLIDEARSAQAARDRRRQAQKACYLFMTTMAGNRPHYEEAVRALFGADRARFDTLVGHWPRDIRDHARLLSSPAFADAGPDAPDTDTNDPHKDSTVQQQRALKQQYRENPAPAGIWAVRNLDSGQVLLGASPNVQGTLNRHRFELKMNSHRNRRLQADWTRLGPERFSFDVVDTVKERDDPSFDRQAELADLLAMWQQEYTQRGTLCYPSK